MPLDYDYLMSLPAVKIEHRYTARDAILHALDVGAGLTASENAANLRFVYERRENNASSTSRNCGRCSLQCCISCFGTGLIYQ
jgi:hypothetical protein